MTAGRGPERPTRARLTRVLAAAALAAAVTPGRAAAQSGAHPADVRVRVVHVVATGSRKGDGKVAIDDELRGLHLEKLRLDYGRYAHRTTTSHDLAWSQEARSGAGTEGITVSAGRPGEDGRIPLVLRLGNPKEPCQETTLLAPPKRSIPVFCDGLLDGGTLLFLVSAEPL